MTYNNYLKNNSLAVFLLHGIVKENNYSVRNYTRKHIEADYFYQFLKELSYNGNPISLDEVVYLKEHKLPYPKNAFAITFDDGFRNNYSVAAPILEDLNIPATFYITSGFVHNNGMSWIDRIEWCFETYSSLSFHLPWRSERVTVQSDKDKIELLTEIRKNVKKNNTININELVSSIYNDIGKEEVKASPDVLDQKMSWEEVQKLNENPLFTVGGHSHTHPILSFLSSEDLNFEINTSIHFLKEKAGIESIHYSYPEGQAIHYNDEVIDVLKSKGIKCAPSAIEGINNHEIDLFNLRRINVI